MRRIGRRALSGILLATTLLAPVARGADVAIRFEVDVSGCYSASTDACAGFSPHRVQQTWVLGGYVARQPAFYDFGGGDGMWKADAGANPGVSPPPGAAVLAAAGMNAADVHSSFYAENAAYLRGGVATGANSGLLQFRREAVLKPANGDGSFEYKNYFEGLMIDISGSTFTDIVAITPSVLASYLAGRDGIGWSESGSWEHLGNCCNDEGRFLRSDLRYMGTARFVDLRTVGAVPEPASGALLLAGLGVLGWSMRRGRNR